MNGRIYDPKLGRMLSPDPVTQAPENGQNYNRYSYANNNPLKYTDPSGFINCDLNTNYCGGEGGNSESSGQFSFSFGGDFSDIPGFGWSSGNGCDRTCKNRKAAHNWCKAQSWCFEAIQGVREKFRKRSAVDILSASEAGTEWIHLHGRVLVAQLGDYGDTKTNHVVGALTKSDLKQLAKAATIFVNRINDLEGEALARALNVDPSTTNELDWALHSQNALELIRPWILKGAVQAAGEAIWSVYGPWSVVLKGASAVPGQFGIQASIMSASDETLTMIGSVAYSDGSDDLYGFAYTPNDGLIVLTPSGSFTASGF